MKLEKIRQFFVSKQNFYLIIKFTEASHQDVLTCSLKFLPISWSPLVLQLPMITKKLGGENWEKKWEQPLVLSLGAAHHFLLTERSGTLDHLSLTFVTALFWWCEEKSDLFSLSLSFCMHNNNMWYFGNCSLPNLGANSPKGSLRDLNSRPAGFVGLFLTWWLSWSSHWCSWEQEQVLRQPYVGNKSRNSSLLLINHSGFLCQVHTLANFR